jgi:hypothetical protein
LISLTLFYFPPPFRRRRHAMTPCRYDAATMLPPPDILSPMFIYCCLFCRPPPLRHVYCSLRLPRC